MNYIHLAVLFHFGVEKKYPPPISFTVTATAKTKSKSKNSPCPQRSFTATIRHGCNWLVVGRRVHSGSATPLEKLLVLIDYLNK